MTFELFQEVALKQDLPEQNLRSGDVVTIVEIVPNPTGGEDGYVLEAFNAVGKSIAVVAVPVSSVEQLNDNEIMTVRPLEPTA